MCNNSGKLNKLIVVCTIGLFALMIPLNAYSYTVNVDENSYNVVYNGNADVVAMEIDKEAKSLLIGIKDTKDSTFSITFPNELISANENNFAVLVNGYEVDYDIQSKESETTLSFFVPYGSQEIEIIGTRVIPEFIPFFIIVVSTIIGVFTSKFSKNLFTW